MKDKNTITWHVFLIGKGKYNIDLYEPWNKYQAEQCLYIFRDIVLRPLSNNFARFLIFPIIAISIIKSFCLVINPALVRYFYSC
jgi:hypothetical protein